MEKNIKYIYYKFSLKEEEDYNIIEFKVDENTNILTKKEIKDMLINDNAISENDLIEIRYLYNESNINKEPKPLNGQMLFSDDFENLYIFVEIQEQEIETPFEEINLTEEYQTSINKIQKEFNEIYNYKIEKEKTKKKNISKSYFNIDLSDLEFPKKYGTSVGNEKNILKSTSISKKEKTTIKKMRKEKEEDYNNIRLREDYDILKSKNEIIKNNFEESEKKKDNKNINLYYLYAYPLYQKKENNKIIIKTITNYEDNFYYKQIFSIYNKFKNSNINANLNFEPIKENFGFYLEEGPDILHIKVNYIIKDYKELNGIINKNGETKSITSNFFFNLDYKEEISFYSFEDFNLAFQIEYNVCKIKLLILSLQSTDKKEFDSMLKKVNSMLENMFEKIEVQNVIFINSYESNESEKEEKKFIEKFYESILEGKTIQTAFNEGLNGLNKLLLNIQLIPEKKNKINYNDDNNNINLNENEKKKIEKDSISMIIEKQNKNIIKNDENIIILNKNSSLNLDFFKNNYNVVIGRNEELIICIKLLKDNNSNNKVCVFGFGGVGKKSFVQKAASYLFERDFYYNVYYIELYSLVESDKILKLKIDKIKKNINISNFDENTSESDNKKNLIIIYFNYIIEENNLIDLYKIIDEADKYFNYLFAFTIYEKIKVKIKFANIELKQLNLANQEKLKNLCIKVKDNENKDSPEYKKIWDNINGYPNDIYLRALYYNNFNNIININNLDMKNFNKEFLIKLIGYEQEKYIKIFYYFSILKSKVNDYFFTKEEQKFIEEKLNYLIVIENIKNEKIYIIDSSYLYLITNILMNNQKNEAYLKKYILEILKKYSIRMRYIVNSSNFQYDLILGFHAGIDNKFWNVSNKNNEEYNKLRKEKQELYFDDSLYSNNLFNLFKIIFSKKKENNFRIEDDIMEQFYEYISEISICLLTILYFKNSFYESLMTDFLLHIGCLFFSQNEDKYFKNYIRLNMFKYWVSGEFNNLQDELNKEEIKNYLNKNKEANIEYYLIKIYYYITNKNNYDFDENNYQKIYDNINELYNNCKNLIGNDNFSSDKLYLLKVICLNKYNYFKNDLDKKKNYFEQHLNFKYMQILLNLIKAEILLENNEFSEFDKVIENCKKNKEQYKDEIINIDIFLKNTNIEKKIQIVENKKLNIYHKNKLFFFMSNPFYDENGEELKTESNNSFYLKYKLITSLPKNFQFEFNNIDINFLDNLKKCLDYPIRFLYIGNDYYNKNGYIYYENNEFKSCLIDNKKLKEIILNKDKNKNNYICDIVILGFLNSENLAHEFPQDTFRHIIYIKNDNYLIDEFKKEPIKYFYFQKCFLNFVVDFMKNISNFKEILTIKESFDRANNKFKENIDKFMKNTKTDDCDTKNLILDLKNKENSEDDIFNFEFIKEEYSNVNIKNNDDFKDKYDDEMKKNNVYYRKNPFRFRDDEQKYKDKYNKNYTKYIKMPGIDSLRPENFQNLIDKGIYSMKNILKDLINDIKNYKFYNIYGNKYNEKKEIYIEVLKYFYMNNYFKKKIVITNIKYIKKTKDISDIDRRIHIKNENNNSNDILILFEEVESLDEDTFKNLFVTLKKLNAHLVFISNNKLNDNLFEQNNINNIKNYGFYNIDEEIKKYIDDKFEKENKKYN